MACCGIPRHLLLMCERLLKMTITLGSGLWLVDHCLSTSKVLNCNHCCGLLASSNDSDTPVVLLCKGYTDSSDSKHTHFISGSWKKGFLILLYHKREDCNTINNAHTTRNNLLTAIPHLSVTIETVTPMWTTQGQTRQVQHD